MAQAQGPHGLLIKDAEGNVYFLRPEILKATKVSADEMRSAPAEFKAHVDALRGGDVAGYAASANLGAVGGLRVRVANPAVDLSRVASDTVMCPW